MANKFPIGNQFQRLGRFPLDETSFYESYEEASAYASNNKSAYIGQHIFVKDARTEKEMQDSGIKPYSEFYFINSDYELEPACFFSRELLVLLTFLLENAQYKSDMTENLEDFRYLLNLGNSTITGPEPPALGNCKITIHILPDFNDESEDIDDYVRLESGPYQYSPTATLASLGDVKVTNSNISSQFTETYYNGDYYQGEDINLIGKTLKKLVIEDAEGNSPNFIGTDNYLFVEFGPSHFATFKLCSGADGNYSGNYSLKRVKLKEGFVTDNIDEGFNGLYVVEIIDGLKYIDTSEFTSLKNIFQYCKRLKEADVSMWDVTLVEDMSGLFSGCESLTTVGDLSVWVPYTLRNTSNMFSECKNLTDASVWHFNMSKVTNTSGMFNYCEKLENIDVASWDISKVTDMSKMFCHTNNADIINQLQNWEPSSVENLSYFLSGTPIVNADLSIWSECINPTYGTRFMPSDVSYMFSDCTLLETVNLSNWIPLNLYYGRDINLEGLFKGCSSLIDIDMTNWGKVNGSKASMFEDCSSLPESIIHDFVTMYSNDNAFATPDISGIFAGCDQVTSLDWSNVTPIQPVTAFGMCYGMENLETLTMKNWKINDEIWAQHQDDWRTAWGIELFKSQRYRSMPGECKNLKTVDMSGWYGSAPLVFRYSESLETINLSCDEDKGLTIPEVYEMFWYCPNLKEVNMKNVCLGNKLDGMFAWCQNLTHINFDGCTLQPSYGYQGEYGGDRDTSSAKNMFYNCLMLQRENISTVGCSDEFIALIDEAFANRNIEDESYKGY